MIQKNIKEYIEKKKAEGLYGVDIDIVDHPGLTLKDEIDYIGLSQAQFATKIGYTEQTVNRIVNEREPITTEMSVKLETAFGGHPSAEFWNNLQKSYDLFSLRKLEIEKAEREISFFDQKLKNLFSELKHYGYIPNIVARGNELKTKAILELKKFFGASEFSSIFAEDDLQIAFRKYTRENMDSYAIAGWVRVGTLKSQEILSNQAFPEFDPKLLEQSLDAIKKLSTEDQNEFLKKLQTVLASFGVVVIYLHGFKHTHIGGALKWIKGHPVIMLKTHKQWEDLFWFNLFHEVGHILKHSRKDFFMDFEDSTKDSREHEADIFAEHSLLPSVETIKENIMSSPERLHGLDAILREVAKRNNVSVPILAGRLCFEFSKDNRNSNIWKQLGKYRKTINMTQSGTFIDF